MYKKGIYIILFYENYMIFSIDCVHILENTSNFTLFRIAPFKIKMETAKAIQKPSQYP